MFSEGLTGSLIHDANPRFRMYLVVVVGIFALGSVLFWRAQLFVSADYVELPDHGKTVKHTKVHQFSQFTSNASAEGAE